jgi:methylsterol monooxygenase/4-alpha-methyl-delta7-sterol-4alpha-methyl oxidase
MKLLFILLGAFVISGTFMQAIAALSASSFARRHRRRQDRPARIDPAVHRRSVIVNSAVSSSLILAVPLSLQSRLFTDAPIGWRTVGEAVAILLIYDFGYYLLHRFAFHEWSVGRRIHSVHHTVRTPYTNDSLYIHPAETLGGVAVFLGSTALIGPVGLWSFGLAFLIYSVENLFIHSGLDLPFGPFRWLTAVVRNHDIHHESMKSGYYASITPIWDIVFGTTRAKDRRAVATG